MKFVCSTTVRRPGNHLSLRVYGYTFIAKQYEILFSQAAGLWSDRATQVSVLTRKGFYNDAAFS